MSVYIYIYRYTHTNASAYACFPFPPMGRPHCTCCCGLRKRGAEASRDRAHRPTKSMLRGDARACWQSLADLPETPQSVVKPRASGAAAPLALRQWRCRTERAASRRSPRARPSGATRRAGAQCPPRRSRGRQPCRRTSASSASARSL